MAILPSLVFPLITGFAGLFLLSSCNPNPSVNQPAPETKVNLPQQIKLLEGSSITLSNPTAEVRFIELGADSRCKPNVQCIWAGDAEVSLGVSIPMAGAPTQLLKLHTSSLVGSAQANAYGYDFKLLEVTARGDTPVTVTLEVVPSTIPSKIP